MKSQKVATWEREQAKFNKSLDEVQLW
jgi:hypothetical protein